MLTVNSWRLEVCIPDTVLELFSTSQSEIRSLTFTIQYKCCTRPSEKRRAAILRFQKLQDISCLCGDESDVELLRACLVANSGHLKALSISFLEALSLAGFWEQLMGQIRYYIIATFDYIF